MIVVIKKDTDKEKQDRLVDWLKSMGLGIHVSVGEYQTVLGLIGDTSKVDMDLLESLDIVDSRSSGCPNPSNAATGSSIPRTRWWRSAR